MFISISSRWEMCWLNGYCVRLGIERSESDHWLGSLCCVFGQDTLLSQCLSPTKSKCVPANCQGNLTKMLGVTGTCDGLAS